MNCLGSSLPAGVSSFLIWHREVEKGKNKNKEGQTPITLILFPLISPLFSPLVILDPIVIFTLQNLLAVLPIVYHLPGSLWTRWSNGSFPSHNL